MELVLAVFAEVEERKAQLPALLRRQDPGGSGRLGRRQLGEARDRRRRHRCLESLPVDLPRLHRLCDRGMAPWIP